MAGIGFELEKLFNKKGIIQKIRANLYASMVTSGPMILGVTMLLGLKYISSQAGAMPYQQDLLIIIITYALLFSLLLTSILTMVLTRYIADMIYDGLMNRILPSMYGAISVLLVIGGTGWSIFLYLSQLEFRLSIYAFILFCTAIVVWIQVVYITAVKDFRGIMIGFALGTATSFLSGYLMVIVNSSEVVSSLLASACIGYGVMLVSYMSIMHEYFPVGEGSAFAFLRWIDKFPGLVIIGFSYTLGMFIHLMIMWSSPWGEQVQGYFYQAPPHDIPALLAFLTTLVTTVNFITSVEVNFYPRYRLYFSLLNDGGSLSDIEKAYKEMVAILKQELFYLAMRQMFVSVIAIVVVGEIIGGVGLYMTNSMLSLFRILCVGYGLTAIGISIMLILLYFANIRDAIITSISLLAINVAITFYTLSLSETFYGYGLLAAGIGMYLIGWNRLTAYLKRLDYNIYCRQPIFISEKKGLLSRLAIYLDSNN